MHKHTYTHTHTNHTHTLYLHTHTHHTHAHTHTHKLTDIVDYMIEQAAPVSIQLHNKRELEQFRQEHPDPVVIAFPSSESDQLLADFNDMGNVGRGGPLRFAYSLSAELARAYSVDVGAVAIFKPEL